MRRTILFAMLVFVCLFCRADIVCNKSGKTAYISFVHSIDSPELTYKDIISDFDEIIETAHVVKYNQIVVLKADGSIFMIAPTNSITAAPEYYKEKLEAEVHSHDEINEIGGEVIKIIEHEMSVGALYHSDTYYNGRLESTYESDWSSGPFKEEKSIYKDGRNTWETITYYTPPRKWIEKEEIKTPKETIVIQHLELFEKDFYTKK